MTTAPHPATAERRVKQLTDLLVLLYTDSHELLRNVVYYRLGSSVYAELEGKHLGLVELAFQVARRIEGSGAAVVGNVFGALREDRPGRTADIDAVAALWAPDAPAAALRVMPAPVQPPAPASREDAPSREVDETDDGAPRDATPRPHSVVHETLDRAVQWADLRLHCASSPGHLSFLVHGDVHQHVHVFVKRVIVYLAEECARRHWILPVSRYVDNATVRTPAEWQRSMHIATGYSFASSLEAALHKVTTKVARPVLFVIGNPPLHEQDTDQWQALAEFLGQTLPAILRNARLEHPIRVLVAVEHAGHAAGLLAPSVRAIREALRQARGIEYRDLPELHFPPINEVVTFVDNQLREHLDRADYDRVVERCLRECKERYEAIAHRPEGATFVALADELDKILERYSHADP
jgi:hypothetical protein